MFLSWVKIELGQNQTFRSSQKYGFNNKYDMTYQSRYTSTYNISNNRLWIWKRKKQSHLSGLRLTERRSWQKQPCRSTGFHTILREEHLPCRRGLRRYAGIFLQTPRTRQRPHRVLTRTEQGTSRAPVPLRQEIVSYHQKQTRKSRFRCHEILS